MSKVIKTVIFFLAAAAAAAGAYFGIMYFNTDTGPTAFAAGNGRIEATEVDIVAKYPGRVVQIRVEEGDMVAAGQIVARIDTDELDARLAQARAQTHQAMEDKKYAESLLQQNLSELSLAQKDYERSKNLYVNKNIPLVQLQQHEAAVDSAGAVVAAARARIVSAGAAINAARAREDVIRSNIRDCILVSPIKGRVQYRLMEPGEVAGSGGKVLVVLDLTDVYMTVFLPTKYAGRLNVGAEARIVLDALPEVAIPAAVSFISPDAQFTPKEIETESEREKLVFRIKVRIDRQLLEAHLDKVKTGLPGIAHVRLDSNVPWPENLNRLPEGSNASRNGKP